LISARPQPPTIPPQALKIGTTRPHPAHIPEWLPPFPDPHTYIRSEVREFFLSNKNFRKYGFHHIPKKHFPGLRRSRDVLREGARVVCEAETRRRRGAHRSDVASASDGAVISRLRGESVEGGEREGKRFYTSKF
jgi:hypothetical protein